MLRFVLLVNVLTGVLSIGYLLAVPADVVAGHNALSLTEARVDLNAVLSQLLSNVLAVEGKAVVVVDKQRIPVAFLSVTDKVGHGLVMLMVDEVKFEIAHR